MIPDLQLTNPLVFRFERTMHVSRHVKLFNYNGSLTLGCLMTNLKNPGLNLVLDHYYNNRQNVLYGVTTLQLPHQMGNNQPIAVFTSKERKNSFR